MIELIKGAVPQTLKNIYHLLIAILANLYFGFPTGGLTVYGITGTDGKTTTATYLYHLLKNSGRRVALISTVGAYFSDRRVDLGFHVTTPDAWQLQRLLKEIKDEGITQVVLEATSHGLDQHRLFGVKFNYAIFTNITSEHLDYHRGLESYMKAKSNLARPAEYAILNKDDPHTKALIRYIPRASRVYYSAQDSQLAFLRARVSQAYNRQNAAAAITAARLSGLSIEQIKSNFQPFPQIPGRLEEIKNSRGIRLLIDFAHTPNALKSVLAHLNDTTDGRVIAIFGAAGERDSYKRPEMGAMASKLADVIILTAEDPRSENVFSIINQIKSGITDHSRVITIPDRQAAIDFAVKSAHPSDTIAVLGKGHERSMNLDGIHETPWSDSDAVKRALHGK